MAQGVLPFKYENEKQKSDMAAFGSLHLYLDLPKGKQEALDLIESALQGEVGLRPEWTRALWAL